ncbi:hypothetical protein BBP40_012398 [Aspergillus hancockii]|nr:hypothetical protein BBP40_012398 [Aspergillus hancockii]
MTDGKRPRLRVDWIELFYLWVLRLYRLMLVNTLRWVFYLFLLLTPTLDDALEAWYRDDAQGRCKSWTEKQTAISTPTETASGWYGPGAYLAWLLTAYVTAISTIWNTKCSDMHPEASKLDPEMLFTLAYPLIALSDVMIRLIRCQIDPGMTAAAFVLVTTLSLIGPMTKLSWQENGVEADVDAVFPRTTKQWVWKTGRFMCHTVVFAILHEPYVQSNVMLANYGILFFTLLYSEFRGELMSDTYPYKQTAYRPRAERLVFFCIVQLVFHVVLYVYCHSIWPATGANILDLDQIAGLVITTATLVYSKQEGIRVAFKGLNPRHLMARTLPRFLKSREGN